MTVKRLAFIAATAFIIIVFGIPASAKVLLKPTGRDAVPLLTRSLSADVVIDKQFSTTNLNYVFQNDSSSRIEADFMYTLPAGAVVTYFAYWAGEEKVVARIVEKKEAAKIYQRITSWSRDPALIEMVGKNTFRARISPVFPDDDLKVEMHIVQALPSDSSGILYSLPLEMGKQIDPMDEINIKVSVKADNAVKDVTTNYGIPVLKHGNWYSLSLTGENYFPKKDMNIRLVRKAAPLQASLYSAKSGGSDGFFVLALAPDHTLTKPKISLMGIKTYDVYPMPLPSVKANNSLVLYGRYQGNGKARVNLTGTSHGKQIKYSGVVNFTDEEEPNNLASKLWAAQKLEELGKNKKNRTQAISLSKRFTLPSKFTSWLAVPVEEMKNYKRSEYSTKLDPLGSKLAELIADGKGDTPAGLAAKRQFDDLCRSIELDPDEEFQQYRYSEIAGRLSKLEHEIVMRITPLQEEALRKRFDAVWRNFNVSFDDRSKYTYGPSWTIAERLADLMSDGKGDTDEAQRLKKWLEDWTAPSGRKLNDSFYKDILIDRLRNASYEYMSEKYSVKPNQYRLSYLQEKIARLEKYTGKSSIEYEDDKRWISSAQADVGNEIVKLIAEGKEDSKEGQCLKARLIELCKLTNDNSDAPEQEIKRRADYQMQTIAQEMTYTGATKSVNDARIRESKTQLKRLEEKSGKSSDSYIKEAEAQRTKEQIYNIMWQLEQLAVDGKDDSKQGRLLKEQIRKLAAKSGTDAHNVISDALTTAMERLVRQSFYEKETDKPNKSYIASLEKSIKRLKNLTGVSADECIKECNEHKLRDDHYDAQYSFSRELLRDKPNMSRVERLKTEFGDLAARYEPGNIDSKYEKNRKSYDQALDEVVDLRLKSIHLTKQVELAKQQKDDIKAKEFEKQQQEVDARFQSKWYDIGLSARYGDPLISVDAPEDALQVIALMPDGEIKNLTFNPDSERWEGRFDIPAYAQEGDYVVTIIVVLKDGKRKMLTLRYNVDMTPPEASAKVELASDSTRKLRLTIDADDDTARVTALLPWNERVEMKHSSNQNQFTALVPIPAEYGEGVVKVEFMLTDKAHNRSTIAFELGDSR